MREIAFRERIERDGLIHAVNAPPTGAPGRRAAQLAIEYALDAHPDVVAVFCPDELSTVAAVHVLRERGMAGRLRVVGVETNPITAELVDALVGRIGAAAAEIERTSQLQARVADVGSDPPGPAAYHGFALALLVWCEPGILLDRAEGRARRPYSTLLHHATSAPGSTERSSAPQVVPSSRALTAR